MHPRVAVLVLASAWACGGSSKAANTPDPVAPTGPVVRRVLLAPPVGRELRMTVHETNDDLEGDVVQRRIVVDVEPTLRVEAMDGAIVREAAVEFRRYIVRVVPFPDGDVASVLGGVTFRVAHGGLRATGGSKANQVIVQRAIEYAEEHVRSIGYDDLYVERDLQTGLVFPAVMFEKRAVGEFRAVARKWSGGAIDPAMKLENSTLRFIVNELSEPRAVVTLRGEARYSFTAESPNGAISGEVRFQYDSKLTIDLARQQLVDETYDVSHALAFAAAGERVEQRSRVYGTVHVDL